MTPEQRQRLLDGAWYLRRVRPLDPSELVEYVEGELAPAEARHVLRAAAFDLGIVEREDGTFVPVGDTPLTTTFEGVPRLPTAHERRLEDVLGDRFGDEWARGSTGDRLRRTIRRIKDRYHRGRPVTYDDVVALGYAIYHGPTSYATVQYVLDELGSRGLLPGRLRVLELGAGTGGPALGLLDYLPAGTPVRYDAVEPSASADVFEHLLGEAPATFDWRLHREPIEDFRPEARYDLVLCANVLSELEDPVEAVRPALASLEPSGALLAIAPADRETSLGLRAVERALVDGDGALDVFAPTLRLWPGRRPTAPCWSFDRRDPLEVPTIQRRLDEAPRGDDAAGRPPATGEFLNVDVRFSYTILRQDGLRRSDVRASPARHAPLGDLAGHVTERLDCVAVKLSRSLADDGNPVHLVGDGSEDEPTYAVLVEATPHNRALRTAAYGDVLRFEHVLVLWNDDEGAYNLVVDGESFVERIDG